jgi:hypothetical protein
MNLDVYMTHIPMLPRAVGAVHMCPDESCQLFFLTIKDRLKLNELYTFTESH